MTHSITPTDTRPISLRISISAPEAITAGLSHSGEHRLDVDPATLTEPQRVMLAKLVSHSERWPLSSREMISNPPISFPAPPVLTLATNPETLPTYLDTCIARQTEVAEARAKNESEQQATENARRRDAIVKALEKPVSDWVRLDMRLGAGYVAAVPSTVPGAPYPPKIDADLEPAYQQRMAEATAEAGRREAERLAAIEHNKRCEEERQRQRRRYIEDWVATHCTDGQRKRWKRNLLSHEEIMDSVRAATFAPIDRFARYSKITSEDVIESYGYGQPGDVEYSVDPAKSASDQEMEMIEAIEAAIPGADVELRDHRAILKTSSSGEDERLAVKRRSIKVTLEIPGSGGITISRELATP